MKLGAPNRPRNLPAAIALRCLALYLSLFALSGQVAGSLILIPGVPFRGFGGLWPMRQLTSWVAQALWRRPVAFDPSGASGETLFFVSQLLLLFGIALIGTVIWSVVDPRAERDTQILKWIRLFLRLGLAAQMFEYGLTKIVPNQFEAPSLNVLVTPAGDLSLNTMLWTSIGAASGYQIFTGCVELLGGILLLLPPTMLAGALVSTAALVQIFVLNMTYDIGLKLTSLHLVLIGVFLILPDAGRLTRFFILNEGTEAPAMPGLFRSRRTGRRALVAQLLLGCYLITFQAYLNVDYWFRAGGGAPRSVLYGIWDVELLAVDGVAGPPSLNDYDRRWRRVIFDDPDTVSFQRTDDSFARYGASIDERDHSLTLSKGGSRNWEARFVYERAGPDRLALSGEMDGYDIEVRLQRVEFDTFRLLNSHFRWIRPDSG